MHIYAHKEDRSLIKIENFEKVLAKFKIKLQTKQRQIILKLHGVTYVGDPTVIMLQPLIDVEKNMKQDEIFGQTKIVESDEELKADLGGFTGDFHRHRIDKTIR